MIAKKSHPESTALIFNDVDFECDFTFTIVRKVVWCLDSVNKLHIHLQPCTGAGKEVANEIKRRLRLHSEWR